MEVERTWMHGDHLIFKFKGVDTISAAERLAGAEVSIPMDQRPTASEGEFYQSDLLGCEVFESTGHHLGTVKDWQETGATPLLVITQPDGKEFLIPFAKSICTKIDPVGRRIEVDLPEGLKDLN
jgi:16S rRNA processing protein RimM